MSSVASDRSPMTICIPIHGPGVETPVRNSGTLGQPLEEHQVLEAAVESLVGTRLGVPKAKTPGLQDQCVVKTWRTGVVDPGELGRLGLSKGCWNSHR